jgi:putative flippase GtrA
MSTVKGHTNILRADSTKRGFAAFRRAALDWARQLHLYTLVGAFVFLLDLTAYWVFINYFDSWFLYAHFISRTIGGVSCFILNRYVTFRSADSRGFWEDLFRFSMLYGASFILSSILVYLAVKAVHMAPVPGKVVAECTVFLFNYTVMKYWVMKPRAPNQ